jgi:hypothetical protein
MKNFASNIEEALSKDNLHIFLFVELFFHPETVRLWSGEGVFTFQGQQYQGVGVLGGVGNVEESSELVGANLSLTLQGINSEVLQWINISSFRGRACRIHLMVADENGQYESHISDVYNGIMDTMSIDEGTSSVTLTCEHRLVDLEASKPIRLNHAQQLYRYPGDEGLRAVQGLLNRQIFWGRMSHVVDNYTIPQSGKRQNLQVTVYADPNAGIWGGDEGRPIDWVTPTG